MQKKVILAIESSCDDTSAAIYDGVDILSNVTFQQIVHEEYGGVVPELASRKHQINIVPVVDIALEKAKVNKSQLSAIAFTRGPGLLGSLIVGVTFAKAMAQALAIPLIEVHHMHAHILAHMAENPKPNFPFLCLTVSGGHTQIVKVDSPLRMEILGHSIDDAAGEAFDKTGKILGLPYPAGPIIDKYAKLGKPKISFPEPTVDGLNFSFSGLKTAILYHIQKEIKKDPNYIRENLNDICASVQKKIIDILLSKLIKAASEHNIYEVGIAGGVSANSELRSRFKSTGKEKGWQTYIPDFQFCTDNAGMIAVAASFKLEKNMFSNQSVTPEPKLRF